MVIPNNQAVAPVNPNQAHGLNELTDRIAYYGGASQYNSMMFWMANGCSMAHAMKLATAW